MALKTFWRRFCRNCVCKWNRKISEMKKTRK